MQDWYTLNGDNNSHWFYGTRKLLDPSYMGPTGAKLALNISTTAANNSIGIVLDINKWQGYTGRKPESYYAIVDLAKKGLNSLQLSSKDFKNIKGQSLPDWDEITELQLTPSNRIKSSLKTTKTWQGLPAKLENLSWLGGQMIKRLYPHQARASQNSNGVVNFDDEFNKAIDDSVALEKQDEKN